MQLQPSRPRRQTAEPVAITLIPVLADNYVIVLQRGQRAVVVDPAVAEPVRRWLQERNLALEAVLQTHHHTDHIGGTPDLLATWPEAAVIAAVADRSRIPFQTLGVGEGDQLPLLGGRLGVMEVPGHTRHHIAFVFHEGAEHSTGTAVVSPDLFCGDTLFAGGCGRLFEGTAEQMHASLRRLAALPEATRVWCAHEYTATNLAWAASERPDDAAIETRLQSVREQRARGLPTLPSSIGLERATNLFLRAADAGEFARLRLSRNGWQG
ncbi:MAG: hydroxyacylglutathione hydrolase [Cyanobium sp.]